MFWHKGKGIISCIILNEAKEVEYADIITGSYWLLNIDSVYVRKIEVDPAEEILACLDSDLATFHLYDLKK